MKKKYIVLSCILVILIASVSVMVFQNHKSFQNVEPFDISDYADYIGLGSAGESVGKIRDVKDAAKKAEKILVKKYGVFVMLQKPYEIYFDSEAGMWLIQGAFRPNQVGGVVNIIIENDTGRVIAIWIDK